MKKILTVMLAIALGLVLLMGCAAKTSETAAEPTAEVNTAVNEQTSEMTEESASDDFGAAGAIFSEEGLTVEQMMTYAIQDEYLARQTYEDIMAEFGEVAPFRNIINAEEYHIALLTGLFDKYGYALPKDNSSGYVVLPRSFEEALQAGVVAEEDNIAMYEKFLTFDLPDDVREAFEELKAASENHLEAFQRGGGGGGNGNGYGRNN